MNSLRINLDRLESFLTQMATIGATSKGGCNRQALTDLDRRGRDLFITWCKKIGGHARLDELGNLFVRFAGKDNGLDPIFLGSHLDTQPTGGKYDGVYGVLAALEVMYTLKENGITLAHPIDLAVWCNEEGARFSPAMAGSGVFSGQLEKQAIYHAKDLQGVSYYDALVSSQQLGELPCVAFPFFASLELHIEQGPILESTNTSIGIVTGVQGMNWYEITLEGKSVHAGPTPMHMRQDPVLGFAKLTQDIYSRVTDYGDQARVTIGTIQTEPSSPNTVPENVTFTLDLRHPDQTTLQFMSDEILSLCKTYQADLTTYVRTLWLSPAVQFSQQCIDAIQSATEQLEIDAQPIVSGAGHDSVYLSKVGPTGMIFIPCKDGLSHNEEEHAYPQWIQDGANVLLHSLLHLTTRGSQL
ncbi:hydantoinase/carbamoylase family amidase [Vibrio sp. CAIM 722]|uniref:Hydantoinase/carbamoylase family amidase n=1 Tax=Vibrio eleionomae TaxID=2653505 RepID=A0A7X4RX14_9VIBR|nr:M20 family metallo-hydrolase [Vibrio eleionomae]MZI95995.1 hydantoinase/carbamoylase family amidase [Vibrio eleionomae]